MLEMDKGRWICERLTVDLTIRGKNEERREREAKRDLDPDELAVASLSLSLSLPPGTTECSPHGGSTCCCPDRHRDFCQRPYRQSLVWAADLVSV